MYYFIEHYKRVIQSSVVSSRWPHSPTNAFLFQTLISMPLKTIVILILSVTTRIHCKRVVDFVVCAYIHPIRGYQKTYCLEEYKNYCCWEHNPKHPQNESHTEGGVHCCDFDELRKENSLLFISNTLFFLFNLILVLALIVLIIVWITLCCLTPSKAAEDTTEPVVEDINEQDSIEKASKDIEPLIDQQMAEEVTKDDKTNDMIEEQKESKPLNDIQPKGSPIVDDNSLRSKIS